MTFLNIIRIKMMLREAMNLWSRLCWNIIMGSVISASIVVDTNAQIITEGNLPVSIETNIIVSANSSWTNNGSIQNEGSIELTSGDWNNTNIYSGAGSITLSNAGTQNFGHNDQEIATLVLSGADKTITSGFKVTSQLDMPTGLVNTSVGINVVIGNGVIPNGVPASYFNGPLFHEGTGPRTFWIGTGGNYYETNLVNVQGTNPIVGLEVVEPNPNINTELPLESISSVRYWQLTELTSNDYTGSQILLPVTNETELTDFNRVVVGEASSGELLFRNIGQSAMSGDATSGTVTSAGLALSNLYAVGSRLAFANTVDSLALVAIYDQTGGLGWNNDTNWKQDFLTTWSGVTLDSDGNVTGLDLNTNNVVGDVPGDLANISGLQSLDLSSNEITLIPDVSSLPVLNTPDLSDNLLDFASLEANNGIPGRVVSPQKTFFTDQDILADVNSEVVINRTLGGTANTYKWFEGTDEISGETGPTLTFGSAQFTNEGIYRSEVTNSIVTDLVINTANFILKVSSLERDRIALNSIYQATGGPDWTDNTEWENDDLSLRFGVTVADNRVTTLRLPANNLQGNMPVDLKDIGEITLVELQDNELRALPDVSSLQQLTTLNVTNNRLGFGDLEPNLPITNFSFDPQRRFGLTTSDLVPVNEDFAVSIDISGDNNQYQWFRKPRRTPEDQPGMPVAGAMSASYTLSDINFDNMGIYYVVVDVN